MIVTKKCLKCKEVKTITEFSTCNNTIDKLHRYCKLCKRTYEQQYYKMNHNKLRMIYKNRSDIINKNRKVNYHRDPEKYLKRHERWKANNLDKVRENRVKHYNIDKMDTIKMLIGSQRLRVRCILKKKG